MATFIDMTQNILSQNIICFDTKTINKEQINIPLDNARFGILDIKANTSNETNEVLEFIFIIDCSASMSDHCSDGRTKMHHITHTLKNMIWFLNDHPNIKHYITVNAFNLVIFKIIERTTITPENLPELLIKIDNIRPFDCTNIEYALINSVKNINEIKTLYPTHKINHIFMTDGEATNGSNNIDELKTHIIPDVSNIFIGFGIDHDSTLLNGISSVGDSSYYFIDKLESSGLVYGEILHSIIYKLLTNVEITIQNGLIYDYKTNSWVNNLKISNIISEANKIFNIASDNPEECKVEIQGTYESDVIIIFPSINTENTESMNINKHLYRQRTLQLLYEVNEFLKKNRKPNITDLFSIISQENTEVNEEKTHIKTKLLSFITEMKEYMVENQLENDKILKNLCDDIYVCYRTFGTRYGNMFCSARQTSQGTQRIYAASNMDDIEESNQPNFIGLRRQHNIGFNYFNNDNDNDNDNEDDGYPGPPSRPSPLLHQLSSFTDAPYLTPLSTQVIRSISSNTEIDDQYQEPEQEPDQEQITGFGLYRENTQEII